jgi:hypothetical protein
MVRVSCVLLAGVLLAAPANSVVILETSGEVAAGGFAEFEVPVAITAPAGRYRFGFRASAPLDAAVLTRWGYCEELVERDSGLPLDQVCESGDEAALALQGVTSEGVELTIPGFERAVQQLDEMFDLVVTQWAQPGFVVLDNRGSLASTYRITVERVPEATTWALMLAGFGMVGFAARWRIIAPGRQET